MTYVLDASAVLRFIDQEAGAARLSDIFTQVRMGLARVVISAINYGEIIGTSHKRGGTLGVDQVVLQLNNLKLQVVDADAPRAMRSAVLHVDHKIPYADSFALELADQPEHVLVTADYDFKLAPQGASIEFLPTKPKP